MKIFVLFALLIYGLIMAGLVTRNGSVLILAVPLMIYVAAGLLFEPPSPHLKVMRSLSAARISPGEALTVTLTITNQGAALEQVYLADVGSLGLTITEGATHQLTTLQAGQTMELSYTVSGPRGFYHFDIIHVTVWDALGLFSRRAVLSEPAQFFIMPEIIRVRQVAIRPPRTGIYSGLIPARQGGPGIEFFGLREYQPGDPLRWINERASARHTQRIFVNEFQQERVVDVGLILDARGKSNAHQGYKTLFEYGVQAAATLADVFIGGGNRVGLFIYGRYLDWTFPGYGKVQKERILRALAKAQEGQGQVFETLEHLPTQLFPVRSQLVLVSPLLPEDAEMLIKLRARGYRLMVISPDPVTFEQQGLEADSAVTQAVKIAILERKLTLKKLEQAGIQTVDWPVDTSFHQVVHVALGRLPYRLGGLR